MSREIRLDWGHPGEVDRSTENDRIQPLAIGVSSGSILAVYPATSRTAADGKRLGQVKVVRAGATSSQVVPCEFEDGTTKWPAPAELTESMRCELVYYDYGDLRLKVAIRNSVGRPSDESLKTMEMGLASVANLPEVPLTIVSDPQEAQWCLETDGANAFLTPAQGVAHQAGNQPEFSTIKLTELPQKLPVQLRQIARAELLRRIATTNPFPHRGSSKLELSVELLKCRDRMDDVGTALDAVSRAAALPVAHRRRGPRYHRRTRHQPQQDCQSLCDLAADQCRVRDRSDLSLGRGSVRAAHAWGFVHYRAVDGESRYGWNREHRRPGGEGHWQASRFYVAASADTGGRPRRIAGAWPPGRRLELRQAVAGDAVRRR